MKLDWMFQMSFASDIARVRKLLCAMEGGKKILSLRALSN